MQQKGTKKQPNVRLFGEFQHFPFTSDAVCFCKSLRWRLQKTVLQVVRIQSLENYGKTSFSRMIQVSNCNKRVQKNSRMFGCLVSFSIFLLRQMLFVFAKVCVGDFKKPFCKSCGYSRLKITAKRLFQNASSVKLQQKGTKKQPNVRLFGEFHFHLFRSHCLKSHVFRATRSGDSADFVLHAFDRPHFSRSGRFCPVFSVFGVGNRSVQFGCRCGNVPYGRANRLRSHQITQTFCVAFSCVFIACCVLSG